MKFITRLAAATLLLGSAFAQAQSVDAADRQFRPLVYPEIRNKPYCEIFLVRKPVNPGEIDADVYNSTLHNDCPKDKLAAMDLEAIKREAGAVRVIVNERRYWMADEYRFNRAAEKKNIGGLDMDWLAVLRVPPSLASATKAQTKPYVSATIARDTEKTYRKGKPVLELISPDGRNWIMQSGVDRTITLNHLGELIDKLSLPEGWSLRIRTLSRDLVMNTAATGGKAEIMQDTMQNVYDACNPGVCIEH